MLYVRYRRLRTGRYRTYGKRSYNTVRYSVLVPPVRTERTVQYCRTLFTLEEYSIRTRSRAVLIVLVLRTGTTALHRSAAKVLYSVPVAFRTRTGTVQHVRVLYYDTVPVPSYEYTTVLVRVLVLDMYSIGTVSDSY